MDDAINITDYHLQSTALLCTTNHMNTKEMITNQPTSNPPNPGFNNGVRKDFSGFARVIKLSNRVPEPKTLAVSIATIYCINS